MSDEGLVQTALERGVVSDNQVSAARAKQAELADRGLERGIWLILQDMDAISSPDARSIERHTSSDNLAALQVEGYVIQGRLGRGGMGDVFLGVRPDGSEAAIKMLPARLVRDSEYVGRFQREVEALSRLHHPYITEFKGSGTVDGRPYLLMEVIRGQSLKEYLQQVGALSEREARVLLKQMAGALLAAWEGAGLVHRDIKPANIMLAEVNGELPFIAKLCDFGLAKFQERTEVTKMIAHGDLTHSGVAIGTPHYMSPEQATGDRSVDVRHDIYSLGATIYHSLLGKTLYSGGSSAVIMYKQATASLDMEPLRKRGITSEFVELLGRMLAKPREERFADWPSVQVSLDALGEAPAPSGKRKPITRQPLPSDALEAPARQRRGSLLPLVFVTIAIICLVAGLTLAQMTEPNVKRQLVAGPTDLTAVVDEATGLLQDHGGEVVVTLQEGVYKDGVTLGSSSSGLHLQGQGKVVFESTDETPALTVETGVRNCEVRGVVLRGSKGFALLSRADDLSLVNCEIRDSYQAVHLESGRLVLKEAAIRFCGAGLELNGGTELEMHDSAVMAGKDLLLGNDASVTLVNTRMIVRDREAQTACRVQGGALTLDKVIIEGRGPWTGLQLESVGLVEIKNLLIDGGAVGMQVLDSALTPVDGVTIRSSRSGITWRGSFNIDWTWRAFRLSAKVPVDGLTDELALSAIGEQGADESALKAVPEIELH